MLRHQRDHHRRIFRALALVDRRSIRQHQLIEFAEAVGHLPAVKADDKLALLLSDPLHDAKIAVVDLTVVIVLDLHDLVARTEGPAKTLNACLAWWIERLLQFDVQRASAQPTTVHWAQHLNIADRVQSEGLGNAVPYQRDDLADTLLRRLRVDEVEIRQGSVVGQFGHLPAIYPVSIDNDTTARRLAEYLGQADDRDQLTGDDVRQHLAWSDRR